MSRREQLLTIGDYFTNEDKLREAVGKSVITDMAILCYAQQTNKVSMILGILDTEELMYDINHTAEHYERLLSRKKLKEE